MAVALLALLSCRCVSHEQSLLRFTSPADGALLEGKQAEVHFEVRGSADGNAGMSVPPDIFIEFNTTKMRYTHRKPSLYIQLQGLEPGTHVLEGVVRRSRDGARLGPTAELSTEGPSPPAQRLADVVPVVEVLAGLQVVRLLRRTARP